ncbi:hypothetical protein [Streptomyces sp. NBC_01264]|uniref:hypothetical protein n=1 Tax=Streptomyces sp. NBC_01264 TaxID=2903804 RepID=UPI00224EC936|nr:hypothetical protein [Streptomyces sp. NBC_01264]MCX4784603.1 hypothetical protein [Streptomyces sp. NBC_01264]
MFVQVVGGSRPVEADEDLRTGRSGDLGEGLVEDGDVVGGGAVTLSMYGMDASVDISVGALDRIVRREIFRVGHLGGGAQIS